MDEKQKQKLLIEFDDDFHPLVRLGLESGTDFIDKLLAEYGGQKPHLPMSENFWNMLARNSRDTKLRSQFKGNNHEQLAIDFELSERQVRTIVNGTGKNYARAKENNKPIKCPINQHTAIVALAEHYGVPMHAVLGVVLKTALALPQVEHALSEAFASTQLDMIA